MTVLQLKKCSGYPSMSRELGMGTRHPSRRRRPCQLHIPASTINNSRSTAVQLAPPSIASMSATVKHLNPVRSHLDTAGTRLRQQLAAAAAAAAAPAPAVWRVGSVYAASRARPAQIRV